MCKNKSQNIWRKQAKLAMTRDLLFEISCKKVRLQFACGSVSSCEKL